MTSAGLSAASLAGLQLTAPSADVSIPKPRILCIGLGGGSLPLFLAHHVPDSLVDVVEIDPTVIAAATEGMGFPKCSIEFPTPPSTFTGSKKNKTSAPALEDAVWAGEDGISGRLKLFCDDGASFVRKKLLQINEAKLSSTTQNPTPGVGPATSAAPDPTPVHSARATSSFCPPPSTSAQEPDVTYSHPESSARSPIDDSELYDLVFIDAYDGNDEVPGELWEEGGPFLRHLADVLHPVHGTVLVNLHGNCPAPSLLQHVTGRYCPGYHLNNKQGKIVHRTCTAYRNALVTPPLESSNSKQISRESQDSRPFGVAFTVATQRQGNIILVVTRGLHPSTTATWQSPNGQQSKTKSKSRNVEEGVGLHVPSNKKREDSVIEIEENLTKNLISVMLEEGERLEKRLKFPFAVGQRVNWRLHLVVGEAMKCY